MKIKNLIVILALAILFGGVAVQNVNALDCTDPTFPGCEDSAEKSMFTRAGSKCEAAGGACWSSCGDKTLITGESSDCFKAQSCCKDSYVSNPNGSNIDPYAYEGANAVDKSGLVGATSGLKLESSKDGRTSGLTADSVVGTGVYMPTTAETGLPGGTIKGILKNLLTWMLEIVGVIALIGFVIAGTQYILASGDEDLAKTAKKNMTYAIIGMIVVLSSFVIIRAIDYALRAQSSF